MSLSYPSYLLPYPYSQDPCTADLAGWGGLPLSGLASGVGIGRKGDIKAHVPNAQLRLRTLGKPLEEAGRKPGQMWCEFGEASEGGKRGSLISSKEHAECSGALDNASFLVPSQITYHSPRYSACLFPMAPRVPGYLDPAQPDSS